MTDQVADPAATETTPDPLGPAHRTDPAAAMPRKAPAGPAATSTAEPAESAESAETAVAGEATAGTATEASQRRRVGLLAAVAVLALAADVVTKVIAVALLEGERPVRLLGGGLYLVLYRNSGAAFSMVTGMTWLLSLIAITVVVAIIRLAPKLRSAGWAVGLGLILGGAAGNVGDRLFRAPGPLRGHVVDFLSLFAPDGSVWPVFNLADSAICVGAVLLMLLAVLGHEYDGRRLRRSGAGRSGAGRSGAGE